MGAICDYCEQDMLKADSCTYTHIRLGAEVFPRNTRYHDAGARCHDCGIVNGKFHHAGCDMERCPKCGDQMLGCSCPPELDRALMIFHDPDVAGIVKKLGFRLGVVSTLES